MGKLGNFKSNMDKNVDEVKCTVIMYHYVRNMHETLFPDIKGLRVKNFIFQLDYIMGNYTVISLEEYVDFLVSDKRIPNNSCILTFDDGLKDHYHDVFPILKSKGFSACFFPVTQPLTEFVVPCVHKVHFLLAKLGPKVFTGEFNQILKNEFPNLVEVFFISDETKKNRKYRWDKPLTANLKYNIATMPLREKVKVLNQIFTKYFDNEKLFCKELYLSFGEMKEMQEGGMSFGGHTHTHPVLSCLTQKEQDAELKMSKSILEENLGIKIEFFAYPYGNYNDDTITTLKNNGYVCGLTTDVGVNIERESDLFTIKRLDTNDVPLAREDDGRKSV